MRRSRRCCSWARSGAPAPPGSSSPTTPTPQLAEAVRTGRRREFAAHGWPEEEIPDPQDPATRLRSCLDWAEPGRDPHASLLAWYRQLIALRRAEPALAAGEWLGEEEPTVVPGPCVGFRRGALFVAVNLADRPVELPTAPDVTYEEVVAAWRPVALPEAGGGLRLPAETAAVLRCLER
ncbi:hypothetical protein GCM10020000_17770 [Streptomyces olivoverticillatus]